MMPCCTERGLSAIRCGSSWGLHLKCTCSQVVRRGQPIPAKDYTTADGKARDLSCPDSAVCSSQLPLPRQIHSVTRVLQRPVSRPSRLCTLRSSSPRATTPLTALWTPPLRTGDETSCFFRSAAQPSHHGATSCCGDRSVTPAPPPCPASCRRRCLRCDLPAQPRRLLTSPSHIYCAERNARTLDQEAWAF